MDLFLFFFLLGAAASASLETATLVVTESNQEFITTEVLLVNGIDEEKRLIKNTELPKIQDEVTEGKEVIKEKEPSSVTERLFLTTKGLEEEATKVTTEVFLNETSPVTQKVINDITKEVTEKLSLVTEGREGAENEINESTPQAPRDDSVPQVVGSPSTPSTMDDEKSPTSSETPSPIIPGTKPFVPLPLARPNIHQQANSLESKKGTISATPIKVPKRKKHSSKKDNGMSSLLYIPLMIQAQMIPMMLMQLKMMALKALFLGKLALLILGLNLLRNAIIGYNNDEQQYEHETLASAHYGYNGGPEYGSWINKRMIKIDQENPNHNAYNGQSRKIIRRQNTRMYGSENRELTESNRPYRSYNYKIVEKPLYSRS